MTATLQWIFLISALAIAHTYLIYPVAMIALFRKPRLKVKEYVREGDLPDITVLVAAYNEEKVIRRKITSVYDTSYPKEKISVYIGSDASVDFTNEIVASLQQQFSGLHLVKFDERVGKIGIINRLQAIGSADLLVMTDANVLFGRETLLELVKLFADDRVGLVAANIERKPGGREGIAFQEQTYLSLENRLKTAESNAFGLIMGAEGGCYAIRNSVFSRVPLRFIVDDFFITLQVQQRGKLTLFNKYAVCYEDAVSDQRDEFRRKARISAGNFQNLRYFRRVLLRFWTAQGFAFWSHKALRWITPLLLIISFASSAMLARDDYRFAAIAILQGFGFISPVLDVAIGGRWRSLKFVSHFYMMNFALLAGLVRYLRGIDSSIWQPVKRNA